MTTKIYHARSTGLTLPGIPSAPGATAEGRVLRQGETFELSPELYEQTKDRNGDSFLDIADDPEAQVLRWGMVKLATGPAPDALVFGGDDSGYRYRQWQAEIKYAQAISDPGERWDALKRIRSEYSDVAPSTGGSIATYQES